MASVTSDGRLFFTDRTSRAVPIRLGKVTTRQAAEFKRRVESLERAQRLGQAPDEETCRWLASLDDRLHGRLASVGLTQARESAELGPWLDKYLASRTDLKPRSREVYGWTRDKLVAFFGERILLRTISRERASEWRMDLAGTLRIASVKTHVGNAKGFFNEAVARGLLPSNPFGHLTGGATAAKNDRYITPEEAQKVIDACPDDQWKALFGLARLAGLRTPSETHGLTWADVDWDRSRLNVRSPKTAHHPGHDRRWVPITPGLITILQAAFASAPEGQEHIVTIKPSGHTGRVMASIIKQAQVEPWDRLWQTCRTSCEKEWAMTFPQYAVSRWIGHSITVSGKHYANSVPDQLFDQAAGIAAQKAAQQQAESSRKQSQDGDGAKEVVGASDEDARECRTVQNHAASGESGGVPRRTGRLSSLTGAGKCKVLRRPTVHSPGP